jgi:hypothetical protein
MEKSEARLTEDPVGKRILDDERQEEWRRQLRVPNRFPRTIAEPLAEWVRTRWPPKVFMSVRGDNADIIVRFRGAPRLLDSRTHEIYRTLGTKLKDVFAEVLWHAPTRGEDTLWSQLANVGFTAYHEVWKQVLWSLFGDQFYYHRDCNEKIYQELEKWSAYPRQKRGRKARAKEEHRRLIDRYMALLADCTKLEKAVRAAAEAERKKGTKEDEIPDAVRQRMWKDVNNMRGGMAILGGEVFDEIPYGMSRGDSKWEKPGTWTAKHMAISLLALERHQKFATIERRLRLSKLKSGVL